MKKTILFLAAIAMIVSLSLPVFATESCLCDEDCHVECDILDCEELCHCQCHEEIGISPLCITVSPDDVP